MENGDIIAGMFKVLSTISVIVVLLIYLLINWKNRCRYFTVTKQDGKRNGEFRVTSSINGVSSLFGDYVNDKLQVRDGSLDRLYYKLLIFNKIQFL